MFLMPKFTAPSPEGEGRVEFVFLGYTADKTQIVAKHSNYIRSTDQEGDYCIFDAVSLVPREVAEFQINSNFDRDTLHSSVRSALMEFIGQLPTLFPSES